MSFFHFDRISLEDNDSESGKQAYDECVKFTTAYRSARSRFGLSIKRFAKAVKPLLFHLHPRSKTWALSSDSASILTQENAASRESDTCYCSGYVSVDLGRALSPTDEESASREYKAPIRFDITNSAILEREALTCIIHVHSRGDISRKNSISNNGGHESDDEDDKKVLDINMAIQDLKQLSGMVHIWKGSVIVYGIKEFIGHLILKDLVNTSGKKSG
ncbi:hypothetical protein HBI14_191530 [Parastagonospora nodorum]|nr:hypothetical protein HBI14_191530 [Parastagonospora nodorum]